MIYDIERLEADYRSAWGEWKAAVDRHHTPEEDFQARQKKESDLLCRANALGRALSGVRHGFRSADEAEKREFATLLEAYKLENYEATE